MTLHANYDHQCSQCDAYYIPYDEDVTCPNCGQLEVEIFPFIALAVDSSIFNLKNFGCFIPDAWLVNSYGDHVLRLIFSMLERHRTNQDGDDFENVARTFVENTTWEGQQYAKEHVFAIACRVYEELSKKSLPKIIPRDDGIEFVAPSIKITTNKTPMSEAEMEELINETEAEIDALSVLRSSKKTKT